LTGTPAKQKKNHKKRRGKDWLLLDFLVVFGVSGWRRVKGGGLLFGVGYFAGKEKNESGVLGSGLW